MYNIAILSLIITFDLFKKDYFIVFHKFLVTTDQLERRMEQDLHQHPFDGRQPQRREGAHPVGEGANSE